MPRVGGPAGRRPAGRGAPGPAAYPGPPAHPAPRLVHLFSDTPPDFTNGRATPPPPHWATGLRPPGRAGRATGPADREVRCNHARRTRLADRRSRARITGLGGRASRAGRRSPSGRWSRTGRTTRTRPTSRTRRRPPAAHLGAEQRAPTQRSRPTAPPSGACASAGSTVAATTSGRLRRHGTMASRHGSSGHRRTEPLGPSRRDGRRHDHVPRVTSRRPVRARAPPSAPTRPPPPGARPRCLRSFPAGGDPIRAAVPAGPVARCRPSCTVGRSRFGPMGAFLRRTHPHGVRARARPPGSHAPLRGVRRRQTGPRRSGGGTPGSGTPRRPPRAAPAAPVIVLIVVVVLLTLGVAYMVITGDGTSEPVDEQPGASTPERPGVSAPGVAPTAPWRVRTGRSTTNSVRCAGKTCSDTSNGRSSTSRVTRSQRSTGEPTGISSRSASAAPAPAAPMVWVAPPIGNPTSS